MLLGLLLLPDLSHACSVCGVGREENRVAFILTTVFMTLLPLAIVGGVIGWLLLRARALAREDQDRSAATGERHAGSA